MADDRSQRLYRSNETPARGGPARAQSSPSGNDPLAELARLIGQSDPFGEFGRANAQRQAPAPQAQPAEPALDWSEQGAAAYMPQAAAEPSAQPDYGQQSYAGATMAPGAEPYAAGYQDAGYAPAPAGGHEHDAYYPGNDQYAHEGQDFYDDAPSSRRRMGVLVIAGVFALAVIGTAGAFGYRALFGSSGSSGPPPVIKADTAPSKIMPAGAAKDASSKLITDRVNDRSQGEKLVSREEKPVEIKDNPAGPVLPPGQIATQPSAPQTASLGSGVVASEPKKIRTIAIHPDGTAVADAAPSASSAPPLASMPEPTREVAPPPRAANPPPAEPPRQAAARPAPPPVQHTASAPAPSNAPLSLSPNAPVRASAPTRTASVAPTQLAPPAASAGRTGGYAVQVTSQRSEADAQSAFRSLQGKYPSQLGGRQVLIHKVDLGAKGTYYRAMVGPFASSNEASDLCSSLKAAGGQCIIQRN